MNQRLGIGVLLAAFAIAFSPLSGQSSQSGGLRGLVVDKTDGRPVLGAAVEIRSETSDQFVNSNRAGRFEALGLAPGQYWVVYNTRGMACQIDVVYVDPGEIPSVKIEADPSSGLTDCAIVHHSHVADPDRTQDETTIW
jgi:hypothetical protein